MTNRWRAALLLAALVGGHQLLGTAPPQASAPPLNLDERVAANANGNRRRLKKVK